MAVKEAKTNKELMSSEPSLKEKLQDVPSIESSNGANSDLLPLEEAQPIQKVVDDIEEERPKRKERFNKRGGARPGKSLLKMASCSCQNCACFGCLSIILLLVLIVLAIYFRPPFLLNPLKKYVNQGYQPQNYTTGSVVDINNKIATELTENGEATITEQELQTLMKDKIDIENVSVDIEPSSIRVVTDADTDSTVPLYILIEISHTSDDKLIITKLGFQRFGAPKFVRDTLADSAFKLLDASATDGGNEGAQFINSFVNQDTEDDIAGIRFEKDKVVMFLK